MKATVEDIHLAREGHLLSIGITPHSMKDFPTVAETKEREREYEAYLRNKHGNR